jgi:hypothetical protein
MPHFGPFTLTGSGAQILASAQLVTELDATVTTIGGLARFTNAGPVRQARHVGWVALGLNGAPYSVPDLAAFWSYFEFENQSWAFGLPNFAVDLLAWDVAPGCAVSCQVNY